LELRFEVLRAVIRKILYPGILLHVVCQKFTDVLKEHSASILNVEEYTEHFLGARTPQT
jgi:hypothetical protein